MLRRVFGRYYSRYSRLAQSDEAVRQMTLGKALDPANPVAPPVPILEEVFNDQNIFDGLKPRYNLRKHQFVTPETPWASHPLEIKGCNAIVMTRAYQTGLLRSCKTRQDFGPLGSVFYIPPWHLYAQARKSRPSLVAMRFKGLQFNGNTEAEQLYKGGRSMNPLDYAVGRVRAARLYRRALLEYCEMDGMYIVMMRKVPTESEARSVMSEFAQRVVKSKLNWVKQPDQAEIEQINVLLEENFQPPLPQYTNKNQWPSLRRPDAAH